jgi:hypothetical protein
MSVIQYPNSLRLQSAKAEATPPRPPQARAISVYAGLLVQPASRPAVGNNDTSALHAYQHGVARYKNGESANLTVTNGRLAL